MHCGSQKSMFKGLAKASLKSSETHTTLGKPRSWWAEVNDWNHEQFTYIIYTKWLLEEFHWLSLPGRQNNKLSHNILFLLARLYEVILHSPCNFLSYQPHFPSSMSTSASQDPAAGWLWLCFQVPQTGRHSEHERKRLGELYCFAQEQTNA